MALHIATSTMLCRTLATHKCSIQLCVVVVSDCEVAVNKVLHTVSKSQPQQCKSLTFTYMEPESS